MSDYPKGPRDIDAQIWERTVEDLREIADGEITDKVPFDPDEAAHVLAALAAYAPAPAQSAVDRPAHYGGGPDDPYEARKVTRAWGLSHALASAVEYLCRAGKKGDAVEDIEKAINWLRYEVECLKKERGGK